MLLDVICATAEVLPEVQKLDKEKSCQIQEGGNILSLKAVTGFYSSFKWKAKEGQSFSYGTLLGFEQYPAVEITCRNSELNTVAKALEISGKTD